MRTTKDVQLPCRQTIDSCGYDFYAPEDIQLMPGEWTTIDTGICQEPTDKYLTYNQLRWTKPSSTYMMLVPRSGLSTKYGFRLRNTVGIIDRDYFEPILATVTVDKPYLLKKGERFMQGIVMPYCVMIGETKPKIVREGGYGSTGKN